MKKIVLPIFFVILCLAFFVLTSFHKVRTVDIDAYVFTSNTFVKNLKSDDKKKKEIDYYLVLENDNIYQNTLSYYVGEDKKIGVDLDYPLIGKDSETIFVMTDNAQYIMDDYKKSDAYLNTYLANGYLYNGDSYGRVDENKYLFLALKDDVYTLLMPLKIKDVTIPTNSFIYFMNDGLRYYAMENDKFIFHEITGVDKKEMLLLNEEELSFEELLKKIGIDLLEKSKDEEISEETIIKEEETVEDDDNKNNDENKEDNDNSSTSNKPVVSFEQKEPSVYHFKGNLKIEDKDNQINKGITFEFFENNKLFLRKTVYAEGEVNIEGLYPEQKYNIVAYYNYINKNGEERKKTFYNGTVTMPNTSSLGPINFILEDITPSSKSFTINKLFLENKATDEVLQGLKKIIFHYNDKDYPLTNDLINKLKKMEVVSYKSNLSLKSNTKYDGEVYAYDLAGNRLKVNNNLFTFQTIKEAPNAVIKIYDIEVDNAKLNVKLQNQDNVDIANLKYAIYDNDLQIIKENTFDEENDVYIDNLDTNKIYNVLIYGDYDLNDGNGIQNKMLLGQSKFITNSLSSLGYPLLKVGLSDISDNFAKLKIGLDVGGTNKQLRELIDHFNIQIRNEDEEVVFDGQLSEKEMNDLKSGVELFKEINNLSSNSKYFLKIKANVELGDNTYELPTTINIDEFKTSKRKAKVNIINRYVNESVIDFDVQIRDIDGAILSDNVFFEVRNVMGSLIYFTYLDINVEYQRIQIDKLEKNEKYYLKFSTSEYNERDENTTFESNKVLYEETIKTENSIIGTIELDSLLNQITNKNLFNLNAISRWKYSGDGQETFNVDVENQILRLGAKNGQKVFGYYLQENVGNKVTVSFSARYTSDNHAKVYINNTSNLANKIELANLSNEFKDYVYTFTLSDEYLSFIVDEKTQENNITTVEFKNLQIELGSEKTSYIPYLSKDKLKANYIVRMNRNNDIDNHFYVRIYNNNYLESVKEFELVSDELHDYNLTYDAMPNVQYLFKLSVKMNNRFYDLDTLEFNSNDEIRTIKTVDDFFAIHTKGNYLVVKDLDFRGVTKKSTMISEFSGTIDFQGYKLLRNTTKTSRYLLEVLSSGGVIKNIDIHYYLDNQEAMMDYSGLMRYNYGSISNVKITLEEANQVPNTTSSLIAWRNNGTIENFVIHSKVPLPALHNVAFLVSENYGTIKNGYAYGKNINATFVMDDNRDYKTVSILSLINKDTASISNVYNLISIDVTKDLTKGDKERLVGALVYNADKTNIKNCYTFAEGNNIIDDIDPIVGNRTANPLTDNIYYFSNMVFENAVYSQKASKLALREASFHNKVINSLSMFKVDELVRFGYYPQLIWPNKMPNQEYVQLPTIFDDDLVEIVSINSAKYDQGKTIVEMLVNNPNQETITNIGIYLINNVNIVKQENFKGRSILTVELSNPVKYTSKYYIKSITTTGAGGDFTINYQDNEKVINVDIYRQIYNEIDFLNITQFPTENYIIMNDIDLSMTSNPQLGVFKGKINGNNHTIKNIRIDSPTKKSLIEKLDGGEITDLFVENYYFSNADGTTNYSGFIGQINNGKIDNVHLNNVKISLLFRTGGLAGDATNSLISNSSVSNLSLLDIDNPFANDVKIGGLIGGGNTVDITNCFAIDFVIDSSHISHSRGIGGLVGSVDPGNITASYTQGKIIASYQQIGGIVGYLSGNIDRVYSQVDIIAVQDNVGGIAGLAKNPNITHSLYVGDLYISKMSDISGKSFDFHRILGSDKVSSNNYALKSQYFNGTISGEVNGETLLTDSDLKSMVIYDSVVGLGSDFYYSETSLGYLPKLFKKDTNIILPNQKNLLTRKNDIKIEEIIIEKGNEKIDEMRVILYNPNHYDIKGLVIEDMVIDNIFGIYNDGNYTDIVLSCSPIKYFDSYLISGIVYSDNGKEKTFDIMSKIEVTFYKKIASVTDWNTKIDSNSFENYVITNDIDFTTTPITNVNIKANRFIGQGEIKVIRGINYNFPDGANGIFHTISSQFDNIQIDNATISTSRSKDRFGIILYMNGDMNNVAFTNSTIDATRNSNVGFVAYSRMHDFRNILIDNVKVYGKGYTGAFIGQCVNTYDGKNVKMNKVTVNGTSNYVGGFSGKCTSSSSWYNFEANDIEVTGTGGYYGGLFGEGDAANVVASNITVTTTGDRVGGISGYAPSTNSRNIIIKDSKISSNGNNIGGAAGFTYNYYDVVADNVEISSGSSSKCIGGITGYLGYGGGLLGFTNGTINSEGTSVGGISGCGYGITYYNVYVENSSIGGYSKVGGILGDASGEKANIYTFTVNANVKAKGDYAGGIIGYVENKNTTSTLYIRKLDRGMVIGSNVVADSYAGGLFGYVEKSLYPNSITNIFVASNVRSVKKQNFQTVGAVIGNNDLYANYDVLTQYGINGLRVYDGSTITAGEDSSTIRESTTGLNANLLVSKSDLKLQKTYTNINLSTSYFDYSELANDKYPKLKNNLFTPSAFLEHYPSFISFDTPVNLLALRSFVLLPEVNVYPSDVDKINIEFSDIIDGLKFTIKGVTYNVTQRTYTFTYDFQEDFEIEVSNGITSKIIEVNHYDLQNRLSVSNNNYYILDNQIIETNDKSLTDISMTNKINYRVFRLSNEKINQKMENVQNIYQNKVLLTNRTIYDLVNKKSLGNVQNNFQLVENKPLYTFKYGNSLIKTYYNYSLIDDIILEKQIFVKNNQIEVIETSLNNKKDNLIIDEYNGKSSVVYLGMDGKLHNMKNSIKYPENFKNKDIISMSSNVDNNATTILIMYKNGNYMAFDYKTGEIIIESAKEKEDINTYIYNHLFGKKDKGIEPDKEYLETSSLINELYKKPINSLLYGNENNRGIYYSSIYNPVTKKYDIYELSLKENMQDSLADSLTKKPVNYLIDNNNVLSAYYNHNYQQISLKIFIVIVAILSFIVIIIVALKFYVLNKK